MAEGAYCLAGVRARVSRSGTSVLLSMVTIALQHWNKGFELFIS